MAENISVSVRIRPLNKREIDSDQKEAWRVLQGTTIVPSEHNPRPGTTPFAFDHVFDGPCETRDVYDRCAKSIMTSALEGQNGTIFVYGQTSSGKTHTMQGNEESPGIVPLGIAFMFDEIKKRAANVDFLVRCSYVEIYNENITDLLNPKNTNMKLHTNAKGGCFVGGVTEPVIAVAAQATELITKGMANRSVGETKMNSESSRSHSLLRFVIESRDKSDASGAVRIAELNLVDLAGSERQSHTQATGTRLKEGANINKSLLTLSNVIAKLSEGAVGQHIPYRDSKLTRMLERALGGNSRTAIICTVTNAAVHGEETLSTLKFATRAKTIKNTAEVNEVLDDQAMLRKYKKEIDQLKKKLRYTSAGGEKDMEICNMINQLQSLQDENAALECEKQELIARQGKLTDLVISAGANMSIEAAAEAHARKLKATTRQSWCPGAMSSSLAASFAAFPSKALGNKGVLSSGIEEGDEGAEDEGDDKKLERERTWRKSSDSSMSLCSAPDASMCLTCADTLALREELVALRDELAAEGRAELVARVAELEAALEGKEQLLEEAVAGGEAAVAALSAELQQVKREVEASTAAAAAAAQAVEQERAREREAAAQELATVTALNQEARGEIERMRVEAERERAEVEAAMEEAGKSAAALRSELAALRSEGAAARAAAAEAAAGAAREVEKLRAQAQHLQHQLLAAEEHAGKAAEAAAAAHGAVVEGLQGMLAQSEADYLELKASKDAAEARVAQTERELEALKEAATEAQFQSDRDHNRLSEAVEEAARDIARLQAEQEQLMGKVVDLEEELDTVKNARQELVLQVQELTDDNDELNMLVKKASGVGGSKGGGSSRMSVYGAAAIKSEGSFDMSKSRISMASGRMSIAPGGMGPGAGAAGGGGGSSNADAAQLRREMGVKEQRCSELEKAKEKVEKAHEAVKTELAALKEEAAAAKKELKKHASKVAVLERGKDDGERELEKVKMKLAAADDKIKALGQERSQVVADKSSSERELRLALTRVEALDKEAEKLRAANLKMKETQCALAAAEKRAAASEVEEERLGRELHAAKAELESTQADLLACADERDALLQQHTELVTAHGSATVELQDLTASQAELEKLCEDMKEELKRLEAKVAQGAEDKDAVERELAEQVKQSEALKEQVKVKEAAAAASHKATLVLQTDLEEAEKQVDMWSSRMEKSKAELARLQRIEANVTDLQEHITSIRAERQRALDELADAKFEIQQATNDAEAAAQEGAAAANRLELQLRRANAEIASLEEDKERLRRQFIDFSDTKDLIVEKESLLRQVAELQTEAAAHGLMVAKWEGEVAHLQREKVELEGCNSAWAAELKGLRLEHAVVRRELEEARAALRKQEEQADKLSASLQERLAESSTEGKELKVALARANEESKLQLQEMCTLRAVNEAVRREIDRCVSEQTTGGDRMLQRIKDLTDKSERAECQLACLEADKARLTEAMLRLEADKAQLAAALSRTEAQVGELASAGLRLEAGVELKEAELANCTAAKHELQALLSEEKAGAAELRSELKRSELRASALEKEAAKSEAIPELKEAARAAERQALELQLQVATVASKCSLLEQERVSMQRMLESRDESGAAVMAGVTKLSDELQEARVRLATLEHALEHAQRAAAAQDALVAELQAAGQGMEAAVAEHAAHTAQMAAQLAAALEDKEAAASELAIAARAVEEARVQAGKASQEAAAERTEAQHVADKIREQAAAQTAVLLESCQKRMQILEYDLVGKVEELRRLEKVRDEAFHKMTLMKAEYTGRIKRREDRIAELEAELTQLRRSSARPATAASTTSSSKRAPAPAEALASPQPHACPHPLPSAGASGTVASCGSRHADGGGDKDKENLKGEDKENLLNAKGSEGAGRSGKGEAEGDTGDVRSCDNSTATVANESKPNPRNHRPTRSCRKPLAEP